MECILRCENCNEEKTVDPWEAGNSEYHQNCTDCGVSVCPSCIIHSDGDIVCDGCCDKRAKQLGAEEEEEG